MNDNPAAIQNNQYQSLTQYKYEFRGNATQNILLFADSQVAEYDHQLQQSIRNALVGDEADPKDNFIFTTFHAANLMGNHQTGALAGNDSPVIERSQGWTIDDDNIRFSNSNENQSGYLLFDPRLAVGYNAQLWEGGGHGYSRLFDWSFQATMGFDPVEEGIAQKARVVFSNSTKESQGTAKQIFLR